MVNAKRFKNLGLPRQDGEYARLKVAQGPDYGSVFVIVSNRITVGRGEDNDVVLGDLKASRKHAEFLFDGMGWKARDLGSANGILHNGKVTREATLKPGDLVTLGETTVEFQTSEAATKVLVAPARLALVAAAEQQQVASALDHHREKIRGLGRVEKGMGPVSSKPAAAGGASAPKGKLVLYGVLGLGVALSMGLFDGFVSKKPVTKQVPSGQVGTNGATANPLLQGAVDLDAVLGPEAEIFFKAGFREYREKNYLRAKSDFENVLMITPGHRLSRIYLEESEKAIDRQAGEHMTRAKQAGDSGRLRAAKTHYEAVMRLLFWKQADPNFAAAQKELADVQKRLKEGDGL